MRLLVDEDVYAITVRWLLDSGHDVVTVAQSARLGAPDEQVWAWAIDQRRALVTRDKGFGPRYMAEPKTGLFLIRGELRDMPDVHAVLGRVIDANRTGALGASMVVVTRSRYRIRRSPAEALV